MSPNLNEIFADSTFWQLSGLVGLFLFFLLVGIRELRDDCAEGYLYLTIALFLAIGHGVMLENALTCDPQVPFVEQLDLWKWLVVLAAPALIALFIVRALGFGCGADRAPGQALLWSDAPLLPLPGWDRWPTDVRRMLAIVRGFLCKTEMASPTETPTTSRQM
jgi:hypothetical protein